MIPTLRDYTSLVCNDDEKFPFSDPTPLLGRTTYTNYFFWNGSSAVPPNIYSIYRNNLCLTSLHREIV